MDLDLDLLASIASGGLGHWVEDQNGQQSYVKDDDCIACLRDLQGFFRFDDQKERPAFFAVSKYNFTRSDLVPLIVTYPEDYDVVYNALKVCVYLTMLSSEPSTAYPTQQAEAMQQVCEAFLAQDALAVIVGLLADPLSRHPKMTDKDTALVELVITFLRNLLVCTGPIAGASPLIVESGRHIKTGLLERLFADDVLDLVMLMAQHARERPFKNQASVLLEITLSLYSDVAPESLLQAESALRAAETARSRADVAVQNRALMQRKRAVAASSAPGLPGSTTRRTVAAGGPARMQYGAAVYMRRHLDHGAGVVVRHTPIRKELPSLAPVTDPRHAVAQQRAAAAAWPSAGGAGGGMREARLAVKLNEYMARFLEEAYTPLIGQVFKDGRAGLGVSALEEDDYERLFRFVSICTRYVRLREESAMQQRDAGGGKPASGDGDTAASAGKQHGGEGAEEEERSPFRCLSTTMGWDVIHTVLVMLPNVAEREASQDRCRDKTLRPYVLLNALGALLRELLLTLDLARVAGNAEDRHAADRLQHRLVFDDTKVSGVLAILTTSIKLFNYRGHSRMHAVHLVEVLHIVLSVLDRLTRQEGGLVVRQEVRQVHRRKPQDASKSDTARADGEGDAAGDGEEGGDAVLPQGEDEEREQHRSPTPPPSPPRPRFRETRFQKIDRVYKTCAYSYIIQFYCWLLQGYATNEPLTNLAIVSFLNRITLPEADGGLDLAPMLWQLSVLRLFHAIMSDPAVRGEPRHADLLKLCTRIVRGLFARLVPMEPGKEKEGVEKAGGVEEEAPAAEPSAEEAAEKLKVAEVEAKMREGCSRMVFIELMFWKKANKAEWVRDEYGWRKAVEHMSGNRKGGGDDDGEGQLGFASYRASSKPRRGQFSEAQTLALVEAFEKCNGQKRCLEMLVDEMGGAFKKGHISKKLRDLGLYRGKFTLNQDELLTALLSEHEDKGPNYKFEAIATDLGAGFTARQVKKRLEHLGLLAPGDAGGSGRKGKKAKKASDLAWDRLVGGDTEEEGGAGAGEGGGSGSDSGSDSASERQNDEDDDDDSSSSDDDGEQCKPPSFDDILREDDAPASPGLVIEGQEDRRRVEAGSGQKRRAEEDAEEGGGSEERAAKVRRSEAADEAKAAAAKRAAVLEMLRKKNHGGRASNTAAKAAAEPPQCAVEPEPQPMEVEGSGADEEEGSGAAPREEEQGGEKEKENQPAATPVVKTFGRRLKKRLASDAAETAPPQALFDDLDDF